MDFMKIIQSLEQLLYELMVWIVFYPRTMFRAVFTPLVLMRYADTELGDREEDRYSDTLSPPIFLAISLGLAHLVELAMGIRQTGMLAADENLIAFRLVEFALPPLMLSVAMLKGRGVALDRKTLRPPFYAQCFVAAPFALAVDIGIVMQSMAGVVVVINLALAWYLVVQTRWMKIQLGSSLGRALAYAVAAIAGALALMWLVASIVSIL